MRPGLASEHTVHVLKELYFNVITDFLCGVFTFHDII